MFESPERCVLVGHLDEFDVHEAAHCAQAVSPDRLLVEVGDHDGGAARPPVQAAASVVSATLMRDNRTPRRGSPENQEAVRAPAR